MNTAKHVENYVVTLQDAEKLFERTGDYTYFRRMDEEGKTFFLIVGLDIELNVVKNHKVIRTEKLRMNDAVTQLYKGGWERLRA
ncbi:hypothetical protein EauS123_00010 [Exiguobacterium phage vB_EauS-123]|nr:hypothetical protein EauS123_00010 [Exiguobacterium phage vB_EauS-123]